MLKDRFIYHLLTVITKEHLIGCDIRTYLQLYQRLTLLSCQRCTVSTYEYRTLDDCLTLCCTCQMNRHLFSIRAEGIKGFSSRLIAFCTEEEIAIGVIVFIGWRVCIGISAIATAIDVAIDGSIDIDSITAIDRTCHIVTTIYIIDMSTFNQNTG